MKGAVSELGAWRLLRTGCYQRVGGKRDGTDALVDLRTGTTLRVEAPGWPLRVDAVGPLVREAAAPAGNLAERA